VIDPCAGRSAEYRRSVPKDGYFALIAVRDSGYLSRTRGVADERAAARTAFLLAGSGTGRLLQ
jgi:hypothetical protein